jgi:hypothetical protein
MKRMLASYSGQIGDFAARAERLGISKKRKSKGEEEE